MTRDDIIRMAREAGFSLKNFAEPPKPYIHVSGYGDTLERFAALVASERDIGWHKIVHNECEAAIQEEREACAKVCEAVHTGRYDTPEFWREGVAYTCAAAIRARSNS